MVDAQLQMNMFDIIVIAILFFSCLVSFFRGFIGEFVSLVAWVGGALITVYFVDDVAALLLPYTKKEYVALLSAAFLVYFTTVVTMGMLGRFMLRYVKNGAEVGNVDNIAGLIFGFIKGTLLVSIGYLMTNKVMGGQMPEWAENAQTRPFVESSTNLITSFLPPELRNAIEKTDPDEEDVNIVEDTNLPEATKEKHLTPEGELKGDPLGDILNNSDL